MGISVQSIKRINSVRIISRIDDAIDHDKSDFDLYDKDPIENEDALKFLPDKKPTFFICNFEMTAKENAKIQDSMFSGIDDDKNPKPAYGAWSFAVVKYSLKGIENPEGVKDPIQFKVDSKGFCSDDTLNLLQKVGIIAEIFNHYLTLTQTGVSKNIKK